MGWLALSQSSPLHDKSSVLFAASLSLLSLCPHSSRDLQLRAWVLVAFDVELCSCLGTFVDAIFLSSRHDGGCLSVVKMKPKWVLTDTAIRQGSDSRDQGGPKEPRFRRCLESNAICMCMGRPETPIGILIANVILGC